MCHIGEQQEQRQEQQRQPLQVEQQQHAEPQQVEQQREPVQREQQQIPQRLEQQAERQANAALVQQAGHLPVFYQVHMTVTEGPVLELEPARSTYKTRHEEKNKIKAARKQCPFGNALTYDMVQQMKSREQQLNNSFQGQEQFMAEHHVDRALMHAFCHGYKAKRKGRPATPEDAAWQAADAQFIQDYGSGDLARRRDYLDRMVDELIHLPVSQGMLSTEHLQHDMADLCRLAERGRMMDQVMADPINRAYFQQMNPLRRQMLEASQQFFRQFSTTLGNVSRSHGADITRADYVRDQNPPAPADMRAVQEQIRQHKRRMGQVILQNHAADLTAIAALGEPVWRNASTQALNHQRTTRDQFLQMRDDPQFGLTEEEQEDAFLQRSAVLLHPGELNLDLEERMLRARQADPHLEENRQTLLLMRDLHRNQDAQPSRELYNRARAFTAPRVQQILDCDVDAWKQLPPAELVRRADQIQTMVNNASMLPDLLALKHPTQMGRYEMRSLTLHQDLVGQRMNELDYKCATLRALAERARIFALLAGSRADDDILPQYLTDEENAALQEQATPEQLLQEKLGTCDAQMQEAVRKYQAIRTLGTPECQEWLTELTSFGQMHYTVVPDKFTEAANEFIKRDTPAIDQAMKRISDKHYYSLAYTPEQLEQFCGVSDIGEALNRSVFGNFLKTEAAQTLVSVPVYRQMLWDMGAGAEVSREETQQPHSEALQAVIDQNARGLAVYREASRAQFEMISRKYGNGLTQASFTDVIDHFGDMSKDFADLQMIMHLVDRYPDFIDLEKPEDRLFKARVDYYGTVGGAAASLVTMASTGAFQTDEEMQAYLQTHAPGDTTYLDARAYLEQNDPMFQHDQIDWAQRVHAPSSGPLAPNAGTP